MKKEFDYIIVGLGCAGLSLAYRLAMHPQLGQRSVLLIEPNEKKENDRTWCFWEENEGPFEHLVKISWREMNFFSPDFSQKILLKPYRYKLIQGADFYSYTQLAIRNNSNFTFLKASADQIYEENGKAIVKTKAGIFIADWVFSSLRSPLSVKAINLLQHFKGWYIETEQDFFDVSEATLMDFRINQENDCRFMYILPLHTKKALVEYTIFSDSVLEIEHYDIFLKQYLEEKYPRLSFQISHEEFGIIPMSSHQFGSEKKSKIIQIGTAGGQTKASTGYTFVNIQKHTEKLVDALSKTNSAYIPSSIWEKRFAVYDNTLLQILAERTIEGRKVFGQLFKKNKPSQILRFLSNETNFWEEIQIMNTVQILKFIRPALKQLFIILFR